MPKLKRPIINYFLTAASIFILSCILLVLMPIIGTLVGVLFCLYMFYLIKIVNWTEVFIEGGYLCYYENKSELIRLPLCDIKKMSLSEKRVYSTVSSSGYDSGSTTTYYGIEVKMSNSETIKINCPYNTIGDMESFISDVTRYKKNIERQLTALVTVLTKIHGGDK
ncbi:hypothetical protein [Pseudolactococcus reticulitermitis]|uniref:Uncharacterized protein n=1 Tax=Pseudolactococcus reticulitermitis TaxID=2025039 RepID=A0A224X422_9LACT|nr:hypothetical protein [Lactococcus reticulitermitis]GAX47456.1 hypothetical protein RsY01_1056 [Lactococcus reticulitermitis]